MRKRSHFPKRFVCNERCNLLRVLSEKQFSKQKHLYNNYATDSILLLQLLLLTSVLLTIGNGQPQEMRVILRWSRTSAQHGATKHLKRVGMTA